MTLYTKDRNRVELRVTRTASYTRQPRRRILVRFPRTAYVLRLAGGRRPHTMAAAGSTSRVWGRRPLAFAFGCGGLG